MKRIITLVVCMLAAQALHAQDWDRSEAYAPFNQVGDDWGGWWEPDGQQVHLYGDSDSETVLVGFNVGNLVAPIFARSVARESYVEEAFDPFDLAAPIWAAAESRWTRYEWDESPAELFAQAMLDHAELYGHAQIADGAASAPAETTLTELDWQRINERYAKGKVAEAHKLLDEYAGHWERNWSRYASAMGGALAGWGVLEATDSDDSGDRVDTGGGDYVGGDKTTTTTTTSTHKD